MVSASTAAARMGRAEGGVVRCPWIQSRQSRGRAWGKAWGRGSSGIRTSPPRSGEVAMVRSAVDLMNNDGLGHRNATFDAAFDYDRLGGMEPHIFDPRAADACLRADAGTGKAPDHRA